MLSQTFHRACGVHSRNHECKHEQSKGLRLDYDSTKHNRLQSQPKLGNYPRIITQATIINSIPSNMIQFKNQSNNRKEKEKQEDKLELIRCNVEQSSM